MQKIREWMEQNPERRRRAAAAEQVLRLLPRGAAFRQGRGGRRPGRAADAGPLDRGRQVAACLWHAVLHRRRTADRIGAIEDAVPPADDRAGHRLRHRRARARRSLFRRRSRGRQGCRPPPPQCALRHAGAEEPRSGGARPQDAGARRAAVGEDRKTVPANRSVEGSVQRAEGRCEAAEVTAATNAKHCGSAGDTARSRAFANLGHPGRRGEAGAAARAAARHRSRSRQSPHQRHLRRYRYVR